MPEYTLQNTQQIRLHLVEWPCVQPRAVIALVHGQGEHIGRYAHVAAWYNQQGMAVVGLDLQGYGRSAGRRGHALNLEALLDDVGLLVEEARQRYPALPLFLYGHSMGGGLALHFVASRSPVVAGIIATSPWIRLAFEAPAIKVMVGRLLRHLLPGLTLPTGLMSQFVSRDPAVVQAYRSDPLVHAKISASAGIALLEGFTWLDRYTGTLSVPVLIIHGGGDRITSAAATKALAGRLSGDVTHREWPDLYHELHNEPEQAEIFQYTLEWIEKRIGLKT